MLGMVSEPDANELLHEALRLPAEKRLALAAKLRESVKDAADPEWDKAWLDELDRRMAMVERGEVELEDGDSVTAALLKELRAP